MEDCKINHEFFPPALVTTFDAVSKAAGYYSGAKSAWEVVQQIGNALGVLKSPAKGDDLLREIRSQLSSQLRSLEWKISIEFAANRYADEWASLIAAKQLRDEEPDPNQELNHADVGWHASIAAVQSAGNPDVFRRHYSDDVIRGRWMDIVSERAIVDGEGMAYDWRLGLPVYLQLIALRLQVLAVVDPGFRNKRIYAEELLDIREQLLTHYRLIKDGIQCGTKREGLFRFNACADVNTGISFVSKAGEETPLGTLQAYVEAMTPLYEVQAMANTLALYSDPDFTELTVGDGRIRRDEDGLCLGDSGADILFPTQCDSVITTWKYDRGTSRLISTYDQGFFLVGWAGQDVQVGAVSWTDDISTRWTYDPLNRTLMNGWGMYLDWHTQWVCPDYDPCYETSVAVTSRNPAHLGTQP